MQTNSHAPDIGTSQSVNRGQNQALGVAANPARVPWESGMPIVTAADEAEWQAWRKTRILEAQRKRRKTYRRIDYYPSEKAQSVIDARTRPFVGGDYSSVIDALVLAGARNSGV